MAALTGGGGLYRGVIFDIRRKTRWQYHRALKLVKRNKENIKAERMACWDRFLVRLT